MLREVDIVEDLAVSCDFICGVSSIGSSPEDTSIGVEIFWVIFVPLTCHDFLSEVSYAVRSVIQKNCFEQASGSICVSANSSFPTDIEGVTEGYVA